MGSPACLVSHDVLWSTGRFRTPFGMPHDHTKSAGTAKPACQPIAEMPALPAHGIYAGFRRRDRERCDDHWAGPGPAGTDIETSICAHGWQNTFPLVRTI